MPRPVTLSTGKVITNVPDDVTDEQVEAQYVGSTIEQPEPVEQPEPEEEIKDIPVEKEGVGFDFRKVLARTQASVLGTGIDILTSFAPKEEREILQKFSGQIGASLATQGQPDLLDPETGKVKETTTTVGKIAEIAPYLAVGSKVAGARAIQQAPKLVQGALAGLFTDQLLADEDENLFNFLEEEFPESTIGDISAYLATNEDDSEVEKRLKLVGEGLALGALVDLSIAGGKGAIDIYSKARSMFNKNAKDLTPEERGEVFVDYLKDSKERAGLQKREDRIEFNETAEGAAQVQQQQSSRLNRVFRQLFNRSGYLTPKAQSAFDDAQYAQRSAVSRAEHIATRLTTAMDEIVNNSDIDIRDRVQEVLTDPKLENLSRSDRKLALMDIEEEFGFSTETAEEVLNAREQIDDISREITGSSSIPLEIKELVNENIGSYLRRSYRLFEDTGFKPSEDVVTDAREYLVQQTMDKTQGAIDIDEAYRQAEIQINNILDQGGFADRNAAGDYFVRSRRINKEILAGKKEIPPEIRALMGEITDPADNIVLTVSKMSRFVETSKFYNNLNKLGTQGKYIFDEDNAPVDLIKDANKITGTNSVLDGKYTTPEIITAIKQNESFLSAPQADNILANAYRTFLSLKGSSQAAKTVFSVTTQARNLLGGLQFGTANGLKPYEFSGAATTLKNQITKGQDVTLDELYEKYLRLGIINTNVRVGEFRSLMESDRDTLIDPRKLKDKLGILGKYGGKVVNAVEDVYVATDDLFKISAYNQELDTLKKAFPDRELATLEEEAANVIRDTLPNYDRVPKGIKSLRNAPLGSFVSFPAEIIRTSGNIIRQASREINSGNSTLRARGLERLGGFATTNGAFYAAGSATAKLAGLTEEERESAQTLTETPWSKDAPKLFLRIDGKLHTSDTQFLDSYSVIKEPIMAAYREIRDGSLQGESLDRYLADATVSAAGTLIRPYVDETILTKAITDVGFALKGNGRTPDGKALFTADMTTEEKLTATPYHILKAFEPGFVTQGKNLYEAGFDIPNTYTGKNRLPATELVAMLGVRFKELDPADSIRFAISDYNEDNRNLQSVFVNYRTTQDQIVGDYVNREKALYRNAQELSRKIEASIDLIGKGKTAQYLKEGNLSNKTIGQFIGGRYMPTQVSSDLIRNAYEKMRFGPGESVGSTVKEIVRQYADMVGTRLERPKEDSPLRRTLFAIGGEVYDVPNAPEEPDERIDRLTGLPYNEQAGGAFVDEEERVEFAGGGKVVIELLADVIEKYSKRNVSRDSAQEAASRIVNAVDTPIEDMDVPVELTTANPKYVEFLETNTRALLDEKHSPISPEILEQAGTGGEEFSRLRGYTDEEIQVFNRSGELQDEIGMETGQDLADETFLITNELDNIKARDMGYDDFEQGVDVEGRTIANQIDDIEMEYAESLEAARFGGDIEEYLAILKEKDDAIKELNIPLEKIKGKSGTPLVLYRGVVGSDGEFAEGALSGKAREGYASFASPSANVAASYSGPRAKDFEEGFNTGAITPLHVFAEKIVEFPVTVDKNGYRRFDMFEFDRRAKSLPKNHVLVARRVVDAGPRGDNITDPFKDRTFPHDVYAWRDTKTSTSFEEPPPYIRQGSLKEPIPKINKAYNDLKDGSITADEYDKIVLNTIFPYDKVPLPETDDAMFKALRPGQRDKINALFEEGQEVGLRLDINAYLKTKDSAWVPTIHVGGKAMGHQSTASLRNVDFTKSVSSKKTQAEMAQAVAEGGAKSPFAQMMGNYINRDAKENYSLALEAIDSDEWIQVGFDPRRHSYFYDRATGKPVEFSDEVIQVGPLVLAKNAKYGDRSKYKFNEGGLLKRLFNKTLAAGAEALGFGAEQQRAHEKEVVQLVKEFATQGLIPERSVIPTDEAGFGKFGAGADEEAFNAFNHAYLVYKHGSALKDPLLQAKEVGQMFFKENPNTEKLDMVNNAYGANLRSIAKDEADAKTKMALAYYNTSKKLAEGKPLIYGEDLVFNVNDLEKVEPRSFRAMGPR